MKFLRPAPGHISTTFAEHAARAPGYRFCGTDFGWSTSADWAIVAARSGRVTFAGWSGRDYGNLVVIDHGDGVTTWYAHLDSMDVAVGQNVSAGQKIGVMGATGNAAGRHLHFELRINGVQTDAEPLLVDTLAELAGDDYLLIERPIMYRAISGGKQYLVGTRPAHILAPAHVAIVDRFLNSTPSNPATFSDDEWSVLTILISQANPLPGAASALSEAEITAIAKKVGQMDDAEHNAILAAVKAAGKAPTPEQVAAEIGRRLTK